MLPCLAVPAPHSSHTHRHQPERSITLLNKHTTIPTKSSHKAEDFLLLGSFFNSSAIPIFFLVFCYFLTLLVIANTTIHRHIEVLLFSTSLIISGRFVDVETKKIPNNFIAIFSEHKIGGFWQKEEDPNSAAAEAQKMRCTPTGGITS